MALPILFETDLSSCAVLPEEEMGVGSKPKPKKPDPITEESDSSLHLARIALSEIVSSSLVPSSDWFWYAEVLLYGKNEVWWPLLSKHIRTDTVDNEPVEFDYVRADYVPKPVGSGIYKRPDFYYDYLTFTKKDVLSVVNAVQKQFAGNQEHISPRPLFAVFDSSLAPDRGRLRDDLIKRAQAIHVLTEGRYLTLFSESDHKEMQTNPESEGVSKLVNEYATYVTNVMNYNFPIKPFTLKPGDTPAIQASLYPKKAWLYSVPIYVIRNGRHLMLATFIIIVEAPSTPLNSDETKVRFRQVEKFLMSLEVEATHLLSHRFYHDIDGYVPGNDPIVLLAHPGLSKQDNLDALRMEGLDHDKNRFKLNYKTDYSILERMYKRGNVINKRKRKALEGKLADRIKQLTNEASQSDEDKAFSWLKPIYAHQRGRAHLPYQPSNNGEYHHKWLDLIQLSLLLGTTFKNNDNSSTSFTKVDLYKEQGSAETPFFHWPVEPGIRLLIPWINLLQGIAANRVAKFKRLHILVINGSNEKWVSPLISGVHFNNKSMIKEWLSSQDTSNPRPNGLIACFVRDEPAKSIDVNGENTALERMARGWSRALIDPLKRKGADTTLFKNLILGDVGAAMRDKGLVYPPNDPLFLPLESSMPIDVDLKASETEILIAVTWQAICPNPNKNDPSATAETPANPG
jgi:hypothetical protein